MDQSRREECQADLLAALMLGPRVTSAIFAKDLASEDKQPSVSHPTKFSRATLIEAVANGEITIEDLEQLDTNCQPALPFRLGDTFKTR
jgi:hypothetical protein